MAKETIGEYLRRERELRQITLEEVVNGTKIALQRLKELENDQLEEMPAEIFVRGFIKSYAEFIGLNPEEVLLRYEEELRALQEKEAAETGTVYHFEDSGTHGANILGVIIVAVIVLVIASAGYWFFLKSGISIPDLFSKNGFSSSRVIMLNPDSKPQDSMQHHVPVTIENSGSSQNLSTNSPIRSQQEGAAAHEAE